MKANYQDDPLTSGDDYSDKGLCIPETEAMYRGKALAMRNHLADLSFTRCDNATASLPRDYWLVEAGGKVVERSERRGEDNGTPIELDETAVVQGEPVEVVGDVPYTSLTSTTLPKALAIFRMVESLTLSA